jgi:hypothetical protein
MTAKIARPHLNEFPDYYTRLAEMEAEATAPRRVTEAAQEIAALKRSEKGRDKSGISARSGFWPTGRSR